MRSKKESRIEVDNLKSKMELRVTKNLIVTEKEKPVALSVPALHRDAFLWLVIFSK